jgi:glucose-6-phosphate isomerase
MANFIAQTEALMNGKNLEQVIKELENNGLEKHALETLAPFKVFEGNKPPNTLLINSLTPSSLGSLVALYEHKIFVQGILWNIFSYDQWGVELGKQLANVILEDIQGEGDQKTQHDRSTAALLDHIKPE